MLSLEQVRERREEILRLADQRHVSNVRVFGSVARGTAGPESDVDFLVKTAPGCTLFDLGGMLADLEDLFHRRVDLVVEDGLKERSRLSILRDAVPV
jgi:predicted nucleotidyltransferase